MRDAPSDPTIGGAIVPVMTGIRSLVLILFLVSLPGVAGLIRLVGIILFWGKSRRSGCTCMTGTRFGFTAIFFPLPIHLSGMPGMETGRAVFILVLVIITIAVVVALNDGGLPAGAGTGTLTGNVSIGPLCPVEPCTVPHDRLVAAYAARPITISTPAGTVVATVTADPETGYSVALRPGTYVIDIQHLGFGGSRELPATVTLHGGETVRLDISIDTGIR